MPTTIIPVRHPDWLLFASIGVTPIPGGVVVSYTAKQLRQKARNDFYGHYPDKIYFEVQGVCLHHLTVD